MGSEMCIRDRSYGCAFGDFDRDGDLDLGVANCYNANQTDHLYDCLLYTSDAADERSSVDLGGRRIIKKKNKLQYMDRHRRPRQSKLE